MNLIHGLIASFLVVGQTAPLRPEPVQAPWPEIPSPGYWVPFEADFEITFPDGRRFTGHFHRGSDGSTRRIAAPPLPSPQLVTIDNFTERTHYVLSDTREWTSHPMRLAGRNEVSPPKMRSNLPGLTKLPEPLEGLEVYRWDTGGGFVTTIAPGLNFFALVAEGALNRMEYRNLRLAEQPASLFRPPDDATVTKRDTPGGAAIFHIVVFRVVFGPGDEHELRSGAPGIVRATSRDGRAFGFRALATDDERVTIDVFADVSSGSRPVRIEQVEGVLGGSAFTRETDPPIEIRIDSVGGRRP